MAEGVHGAFGVGAEGVARHEVDTRGPEREEGLAGLRQVLKLPQTPRTIEGVDIAHLSGGQTVIHVLADDKPADNFEAAAPDLEDVYFSTLIANGIDVSF